MTISKYGLTPQLSAIAKKVAWVNIFIQFAFPISATIPSNVFAKENIQENQFINKPINRDHYQVQKDDTPESIAKKFNIKLSKLIEDNPDYVSLVGKLKIKEGIILNIPKAVSHHGKWLNANEKDLPEISTDGEELAQLVVNNASLLNKDTDATQYAISQLTNKANAEIEQWLSQFGHARVSLSTDKNFTLESSSADLLVPLYDQEKNLVFSQTSYHRKDSRSQFNQGIGYRYFADRFMLGVNAFYDYDLSRYHSRFGIGAEIWRDYFKLSTNHYHRLSNWRTSDDVMDYNERPANGWDIRTEGYLPNYPQLGAKLTFEQYYGDEVGLFGKDNRQKNPHAYTAGLTYTPVPLITFGAERRFGLHDNSDSKLDISVQYRLGESLLSQLNPDNVRAMRLMSGSRYDFVDRNNDIVLEYKKKTLVFLSIAPSIMGYAKEEKDLAVQVRAKYPVKQIEWSASSLIANGGKINHNGAFNYSVTLPRHISGANQKNSYLISAVAIDEQGNRSEPVQSKVVVDQSAINTTNSQFTPTQSQLPADGHSTQTLTLSVLDNDNLPVDINLQELSLETQLGRQASNSKVSPFTRIDTGKYQATVTAGSVTEKLILTPKFRDNTFNQAEINFIADTITAHIAKGDLTVIKDNAFADGKSENKIKIIVTDLNNNPIANYPITLSADNGAKIIAASRTSLMGDVIIPITNTHTGMTHITVTVKDIDYAINVNFIADEQSAYIPRSYLTITPNISLADNISEKIINLTVIDKNKNPVPNTKVILRVDNQAQIKDAEVMTDKDGKASTTMVSKIAGDVTVKAEVITSHKVTEATSTFISDISDGKIISVTPSAPPYIADGKTEVTFTAEVKDNFGNPLPNANILWSTDRDKNIAHITAVSVTDKQGITHAKLTSTQALPVTVTATTNNHSLSAPPITFIADNQQGLIKSLSVDKTQIVADAQEKALLTATVEDKFGNKLPNVAIAWQTSNGSTLDKQQTTTDAQGKTTDQISANKAGLITVTAKLANGEQAQATFMAIADPNSAVITLKTLNNKTSAIADNSDAVTVVAVITDANNNPLAQHPVFWQSTHNTLSKALTNTNDKGETQVDIKGTQAILTTVTANLLNKQQASKDITFTPAQASAQHSHLTLDPQSIIADGKTFSVATISLNDKFGNPVPKQDKKIALTGDNSTITFSAIKEISPGVYQANISGQKEGMSTISATYQGISLTQPLGFIADKQNARLQSVTVVPPNTAIANGNDKVTVRATITDTQGNTGMEGINVGWITTLGTLSPISKTDSKGIAEITLSSTQAGTAQVTAMLDSTQFQNADNTITFTPDVISADHSTLALSPTTITAGDGTHSYDKSEIIITLKDKQDNLLTGLKDEIDAKYSVNLNLTTSAFKEVKDGVYQATIYATKAGNTTVSAQVKGVTLTQNASLTVIADNLSAKVDHFDISDTAPKAGDTITYTAHLIDNYNNPVNSGVPVTWTSDNVSVLSNALTFTDDKGTTQTQLTRGPAGLAKVNAVLRSGSYPAKDVNFVASDVDENNSELTLLPATIIANGKDKAILTLLIKDKGGNILPDQTVKGTSSNPTIVFGTAKQVSPAKYEIEVTGTKSGTADISVSVNGTQFTKHKTLQLNADSSTWKIKDASVSNTTIIAGDTNGVTYQASVVDANDNILPNVIVSWKLRGLADDYDFSTYTDAQGIAKTKVTSHVAGILQMSAYLDLNNHKPIDDVTVQPAAIDADKSTLSSNRQSIGGDNQDKATLTVKLVDKYDNVILGKKVTLSATKKVTYSQDPLADIGKGEYQTDVTSNIQGDVTFTAKAESTSLTNTLTINVTAPKPIIVFDKKLQQEVYSSTPVQALGYTGLPSNLKAMWSSSEPTVATIDAFTGEITLLKAGQSLITLQTTGDDHFLPAENSYPLLVEKADPGLSVTTPQINSTWNDGITQQISATFSNPDSVKQPPSLQFSSANNAILTVDNQGSITAVKPGDTTINVKSDATDQFKVVTAIVNYHQDKGSLKITFDKSDVIVTQVDTNIQVQQPNPPLPKEAQGAWSATNPNVVGIKTDGTIVSVNPGTTDIILTSKENDYFYESKGSYSINVKKAPYIQINSASRRVDNILNKSDSLDPHKKLIWTPVYEDDILSIKWKLPDEINERTAVNLELWDGDTKVYQKDENKPDDVRHDEHTSNFKITKEMLESSRHMQIKVIAFDIADGNAEYATYYPLDIKFISPQYMDYTLTGRISFITTRDASIKRSSCRATSVDEMTHVIATPIISLGDRSQALLVPVSVSHKLINIKGSTSRDSVNYNDEQTYSNSIDNQNLNPTSPSLAMMEDCWNPVIGAADSGQATLVTSLTINGVSKEIQQNVLWNGTGDPSANKIETVDNKAK